MPRVLVVAIVLIPLFSIGQTTLQPIFDVDEYLDGLSLAFYSSSIPDSNRRHLIADPYKQIFRSPETGFLNRWTYYQRSDNTGWIDTRGTVNQLPSWLGNFYAAMVPASGSLTLNDSTNFPYRLATDPRAMVHVGWLVGLGHIAPGIVSMINKQYEESGTRNFILFGHSQGAGITFLLRSYLHYLQQDGSLPKDIILKTYCSGAPKPGNMYYAYDFDFITRGGWAYTIVNASDWVPETPFSVQTLSDFNTVNPFTNAKVVLKKQKLLVRIAGTSIYNKLNRSTRKAQKQFTKYLGHLVYKQSKNVLPQLKQPQYSKGNNYMRTGVPVILLGDDEYHRRFPDSQTNVFIHHMFQPYSYLAKKIYAKKND